MDKIDKWIADNRFERMTWKDRPTWLEGIKDYYENTEVSAENGVKTVQLFRINNLMNSEEL